MTSTTTSPAIERTIAESRERKHKRGPNGPSLEDRRASYAPGGRPFPAPPEVRIEATELAGVPASWVVPPGVADDRVLLFVHGGGFTLGSIDSYAELVARLAGATGARAVVPEYRLVPEHPFPAGLDDVRAAWGAVRASGVPASSVVVAGDSAGGNLVPALLVALRDAGEDLPAAAYLMSPFVDLTCSGTSMTEREDRDPLFTLDFMRRTATGYAGNTDLTDPLVSPLFAPLHGLPPLLVQVGSEEVLYSDAERLVDAARAAGVDATLEVGEGMLHDYQAIADAPEAVAATDRAGAFLRRAAGWA
ncbi:alpha/beta hydrolase [Luteimicrobium sp. DT211]|uniref:alpha/beta hydrolase n=1 Tax=Luteimicrobium sp. DT211 TaxID=3393412 RepID=UPI003CEB5F60